MANVTIKDVAIKAHVGVGTVSRVINGAPGVSKKTIDKVNKAIEETGFTPNALAQGFRKSSSNLIALMVPIVNHPFFSTLIEEVEKELDNVGYKMLLVASQRREEKESEIINLIKNKKVDGAIFVTHFPHKESEIKGCAIVSIDRYLGDRVPVITSNNYEGTLIALNHLLEKGCKKIAFLGGEPDSSSTVTRRRQAYSDFIKEHNLKSYCIYEHCHHGDEDKLCKKFLDLHKDVDGVFVAGYQLGIELLRMLPSYNKKCPEDLQVVVYDGVFDKFNVSDDFTAVVQPIEQMAKEAVRLLINKIREDEVSIKELVLNVSLHKGKSTM